MKNLTFALLISLTILGCAPQRDLVYFSNLSKVSNDQIQNAPELKLQKNDQLSISLTSLNTEYNVLFASANANNSNTPINSKGGFKVNNAGNIALPLVGDVKVEGLSLEEAKALITQVLKRQIKDPYVDLQLVNFKITVIGEVNRPASLNVPGEQINLLEALGMAGDMTVYGKRENVLVIREEDGVRNMVRLNLNDKNSYSSPYFNLKQNDIVYVEPDKAKEKQANPNNQLMPIVSTLVSAAAVILTIVLR
ncbi:polysaccharide biosynthesis/export family protein [Pedobacter sp. PLR]|uniref:polysaccharide biosynthesis/export family protein n=1 Tax=Pedobacter sp. PLR TaxID=2994465 RepID=UPI002246A168|nr:polysaccharide biosynthesis/export family protein [Pedobacter sp. PLR]MCX2449908.1 polysaccharide biosynthesis/export family protein [Pedobacter sp. PLR]